MKTISYVLSFLAIILCQTVVAQPFSISGRIVDETDTIGLPGVNLFLAPVSDSNSRTPSVTDEDGNFIFSNLQPGQYLFRANYIGFTPYTIHITVNDHDVNLGNFNLQVAPNTLEGVVVVATAVRTQQLGDTTQFAASGFKVNPDANAEDLVTKMPGISTENNTIKVNGEDVKEILVDGKPFFGDDPNAAIKNLPAEVIDKIQVFDKLSDQSQFTGFDNGESSKTINIITKPGRNTGQFGKIYAGAGIDAVDKGNTAFINGIDNGNGSNINNSVTNSNTRYNIGGNVNFFNGNRRVSIIALSNNINQQNFSTEDLMGVVNTSSGQGRGGSGGRGGSRGGGGYSQGGGNGGYRGGGAGGTDVGNFLVGQQGGITQTHALGINYSDNWGKKVTVSGSYFFNNTDNNNNTVLHRQYFSRAEQGLVYDENSFTNSKNQNHRFNLRLEYNIDSFNSILLTPRLSVQNNDYSRRLTGLGQFNDNTIDSRTLNTNTANNTGFNFSNNLLYRHRFAKKGRTISLNLGTQFNGRDGDGTLYSLNEFALSDTTLLDQQYDLQSKGYTLSGNVTYTEPIGDRSQLMASYSPSFNSNNSDKETNDRNPATGNYDVLNPLYSNTFDNTYTTQRGGLSYRYNYEKINAMISVDGQYAQLEGDRTYPRPFTLDRTFNNVLPRAMFNFRFTKTQNLRLMYRTNTNPPSISQLQDVVDNTNPLILKTGNPDLKQDYSHTLIARYGGTSPATSRSFFVFVYGNFVNNYIANATYIPNTDTFFADIANGLTVNRGAQLNRPVNLNGYMNGRSFVTYGLPVAFIKSNVNLNAGFSYSKAPSMINSLINFSRNYTINGGLTIGSNISENIDFTLNYSGNYSIVKNTLQTSSDNTYYSQNTSLRFNWIFLKNFVFNTTVNHTLYTGLTQSFNQSFLLWNAAIGYKFLKDRSLDVRLSAFDILNQNRSISRQITDIYLEDTYTSVLQRYLMLTATYTLRRFGGAQAQSQPQPRGSNMDMRPAPPQGRP